MWMLFSTAAGALTSVLITTLFKVANYFTGQPRQTRFKSTAASPRTKTTYRKESTPPPASPPPSASKEEYASSDTFDDWNSDRNQDDDWNFDERPREAPTSRQQVEDFQDSKTYERPQQPKSSSQSGSVYSYNYREPKNTAVGKTESVYDADYRVIIPPYQPPTSNQTEGEDDDWGFFDDEDSEDENKPSRR
jgi:hypothetical protein